MIGVQVSQVQKDMDDMWVCDYCGSEEVQTRAWIIINTEHSH